VSANIETTSRNRLESSHAEWKKDSRRFYHSFQIIHHFSNSPSACCLLSCCWKHIFRLFYNKKTPINFFKKKENRKQKRRETYLEQQITNEHRKTSHAVRLMSCQRCARYDKQQQQKNNKKPKIGDAWRAQFK